MQNGGNWAKLKELLHNQHPSGVKMLAKFIRFGFSVIYGYNDFYLTHHPVLSFLRGE